MAVVNEDVRQKVRLIRFLNKLLKTKYVISY